MEFWVMLVMLFNDQRYNLLGKFIKKKKEIFFERLAVSVMEIGSHMVVLR